MGRPYAKEVAELAQIVEQAAKLPLAGPLQHFGYVASSAAIFVGSGGARAVADMGAMLHRSTGRPAWSMSPLELEALPPMPNTTVVVVTASGRNRDTRAAVRRALSWDMPPVVLTSRPVGNLHPDVAAPGVNVIEVPTFRDGFLATASTVAFSIVLCRAYGYEEVPADLYLSTLERLESLPATERLLVLYGPEGLPAAVDLEARLSETGLRAVQTTDLRNFAHGRHVGLQNTQTVTGALVLVDTASRSLAEATIALLPEIAVGRLSTDLPFPFGTVDLLLKGIIATGAAGRQAGLDPGRPTVPQWGRRLYSLPRRAVVPENSGPVDRKLMLLPPGVPRNVVAESFAGWLDSVQAVHFGGLVIDYDGTCCTTRDRYEPMSDYVSRSLTRLLSGGMIVGVASGRGRSLFGELRSALPDECWDCVLVGTYNGYDVRSLADEPPIRGNPSGVLTKAASRLADLDKLGIQQQVRAGQIQIEAPSGSGATGTSIASLVTSMLERPPRLNCRVVTSAHSVDVLAPSASKLRVHRETKARSKGEVLVIGDQGSPGGNDHELLACTRWSLTVGASSADPTRCWRLGKNLPGGPSLLVRYLDALQASSQGWLFDWRDR
jgi:hypothetical protein